MTDKAQRLRAEALRVYQRYAVEVIEAFGLCPWAAQARRRGQVRVEVLLGASWTAAQLLPWLDRLALDVHTEIGLLVLPQVGLDALEFEHFAAEVRRAETARGRASTFALADFHPGGVGHTRSPEAIVRLVRRSPDPTLQLVRHTALANVRGPADQGKRFVDPAELDQHVGRPMQPAAEPLHARVARVNQETLTSFGEDRFLAILEEIARDRAASYAALDAHGEPAPG